MTESHYNYLMQRLEQAKSTTTIHVVDRHYNGLMTIITQPSFNARHAIDVYVARYAELRDLKVPEAIARDKAKDAAWADGVALLVERMENTHAE